MKLWKYSGTFLTLTGVIHTIYAFFIGKETYWGMLKDGLFNLSGENYEQDFAFWFLVCGIILIFWGQTLQLYIEREQKPAPQSLGYSLLIFTLVGCFIMPASGFWLFLPQALIIVFSNRRQTGRA
jgi:uncharacterized membrane protein HdeD (DUF308 family)